MKLVSIIIPIYNTAQYLPKCLDSVINQTLTDIEIICVNDGSTDNSPQILQEYVARDERIKIIQKENGGLVSARKAGVMAASGQYIGYVDSDDWIESDMYEKLYAAALQYQVDMVSCGYCLEGNYTTQHFDTMESGLYDIAKMDWLRENTIYKSDKRETGLRGSLCCKLLKKEIFKSIQLEVPDSITIAEDKMCLLHYMLHCQSVYVMREALYHWCIHSESMSHKANPNYLVCVNEVYKYLIGLYEHENFTEKMRTQAEIYITELLVLGINTRLGFSHSNLLRIDPYWLSAIPQAARVILYGGGDVGEQYLRQMKRRADIKCVGCLGFEMPTEEQLQEMQFDVLVIAIKNPEKAQQIKEQFMNLCVAPEKILWFEQPEVYWKYAEAEGWLDNVADENKDVPE